MKRIGILQSNYVPWKGYFDLIASVDHFVFYDQVQFTKNDWRNRNILTNANGPFWITIPVQTKGTFGQTIETVRVSDGRWARRHWTSITHCLSKRPHFKNYRDELEDIYFRAEKLELLSEINQMFIVELADLLDLKTVFHNVRDFTIKSSDQIQKLVEICTELGGEAYVTGPAGLDYIRPEIFAAQGLSLEVISYDAYQSYPQQGTDFNHHVSILDLLANVGDESQTHLHRITRPVESPTSGDSASM